MSEQMHDAQPANDARDTVQPMAVRLRGAGAVPRLSLVGADAATPVGYRLSGLLPGRPYCLSSAEERDETTRQVRAYFGYVDFWEPV